jgi:hypothetical protein
MFTCNINTTGRILRGILALMCFIGAWFAFEISNWFGFLLAAYACFALFEAIRGWCIVRACGIKTKY